MADATIDSLTKKKRPAERASAECKICAGPALYSYFGAVVCSPCKMFFKRNAECAETRLKCHFGGNCEINVNNRHICSYCRLMKCFQCGMEVRRIRPPRPKRKKTDEAATTSADWREIVSTALVRANKWDQKHPFGERSMINMVDFQLPTLNLLRADQSTLTSEQWILISNLLHCYDAYSGLEVGDRFAREQNALPPKQRLKSHALTQYAGTITNQLQLVYEKNQDFVSLVPNDRSILLQSTFKHAACLATNFVVYKAGVVDFGNYYEAIEGISNADAVATTRRFPNQFDPDVTVHKLLLAILSFSTISHTVYMNNPTINLSNVKHVFRIQDTYIELLWRYLLYRNNFKDAVRTLLRLVQSLLIVDEVVVKIEKLRWFVDRVDTLVRQIEENLVVND